MTDRIRQIPLKFKPKVDFQREDFMVAPCNCEALNMVESWPEWPFFALLLYGPKGCGKSHLAHVFAEHVSMCCERPIPVSIINAREIKASKVDRLHRDNFCLVIENLTPKIDQSAMFHLFNLYQNEGGYILLTAEQTPARMGFSLPDLRSRLNIIPCVSIDEPDDNMLSALIIKLFTDRQLAVSVDVLNYIVRNMQRSFSYAQKLVAEIDETSLAYKRAISVPIVKEAMRLLDAPEQPELF